MTCLSQSSEGASLRGWQGGQGEEPTVRKIDYDLTTVPVVIYSAL